MLDANKPADNELASLLAYYIRETRQELNTVSEVITTDMLPPGTVFANADTSPSVAGTIVAKTANAGATTIVFLDDGYFGQLVIIIAGDSNTTIQHDPGLITLTAGNDVKLTAGETVALVYDGTIWREVGGAFRTSFAKITDAIYNIQLSDRGVLGNAGIQAQTFTLPSAAALPAGTPIEVKKIDSTANTVTVESLNGEYIDTGTSYVLVLQNESATFKNDGIDTWWKFN